MKKALMSFNMMMWIPRFIFLTIVLLSVIFMTQAFLRSESDTSYSRAEIFSQSLIYSPKGISYYSPLENRIYPGVIEPSRMDNIEKRIETNQKISAMLELQDLQGRSIKKTYYKEEDFSNNFPIAQTGLPGKGGVLKLEKELFVLYKDNNMKKGKLKQIILIPRR